MFVKVRIVKCRHYDGAKARESCPYYKWWGDFRLTSLCSNCIEGLFWEVKCFDKWGESWDAALGFKPLTWVWEKNPSLGEYIKEHLPASKYTHGMKKEISIPAEKEREFSKNFLYN